MDNNELKSALDKILVEFEGRNPTHPKLADLAKKAKQLKIGRKKLETSLQQLQESLDYLRVCIKYQLFDLEATQRENQYLRKLLEEKRGHGDQSC